MLFSPRIGLKPLAGLCRRLATSFEAGIDLRRIFQREAQHAQGAGLKKRLETIARQINRGENLASALEATEDYFPILFRELVAVGEETGRLADVLAALADDYQHRVQLRRTFLAAITWPMAQLGIALFVIGFLIWVLGAIGQSTGRTIDILGFGLTGNRGLAIYLAFVGTVGGAIAFVIYALQRGVAWTAPVQRAVLAMPGLGPPLQTLALARLAWSMHLTFGAGMEVRRALGLSLRSTRNARYTDQIDPIERALGSGDPLFEAFSATNVFPSEFLESLLVAEESGRLSESMDLLSRQYQDRAKAALAALTTIAGFAVWGVVALIIIVMIFRIFMFYVGTINALV